MLIEKTLSTLDDRHAMSLLYKGETLEPALSLGDTARRLPGENHSWTAGLSTRDVVCETGGDGKGQGEGGDEGGGEGDGDGEGNNEGIKDNRGQGVATEGKSKTPEETKERTKLKRGEATSHTQGATCLDLEIESGELCEAVEIGGEWVIEEEQDKEDKGTKAGSGDMNGDKDEDKERERYFNAALRAFDKLEEVSREAGRERCVYLLVRARLQRGSRRPHSRTLIQLQSPGGKSSSPSFPLSITTASSSSTTQSPQSTRSRKLAARCSKCIRKTPRLVQTRCGSAYGESRDSQSAP